MVVTLGNTKLFSNHKEPSSLLTKLQFVLNIGSVKYCHGLDHFNLAERLLKAQGVIATK